MWCLCGTGSSLPAWSVSQPHTFRCAAVEVEAVVKESDHLVLQVNVRLQL